MRDIPDCDWLSSWTDLTKSLAFRYNPPLQPRALIILGCISKSATDCDMNKLLSILVEAMNKLDDFKLIEGCVFCMTRLEPLLRPDSPIHKTLFWVATCVMEFDDCSLYATGLALLEQNLHTLEAQGLFNESTLEEV